jgi:hypothetical protein
MDSGYCVAPKALELFKHGYSLRRMESEGHCKPPTFEEWEPTDV